MEGASDSMNIPAPGSCMFLVNPWRRRRSIFTTQNSSRPPLMTYPMPPLTGAALPNRPQLRLIRLSPFPHFVGPPPFQDSQPYNGFARLQGIVNPAPEQVLDGIDTQNESLQHEQQWEFQNNLVLNQDTFPPTPSPTSIESNNDDVPSTSNQQRVQDTSITEGQQIDSLDTSAAILDTENSENMNATFSSSDELIFPTPNETIYEIQVDTNTGEVISQNEISNGKQITTENEGTTTFNSVEEAVATIDFVNLANDNSTFSSELSIPESSAISSIQADMNKKLGMNMTVTDEKQEEVVKAAKSLFSKRTRTLYHWLYPDTSKNKLKATVSAAWDTLPENEKHFYISQVLGRFGLQASSLMINPQLGGMKGLPSDLVTKSLGSSSENAAESQRAVENLFASCEDADNWASYPTQKRRHSTERRRKRKSTRSNDESGGRARLGAVDPDELDEETAILKRMREENLENEFEEDAELTSELEKFRLISQNAADCKDSDDFWSKIPDPEDIFSQMDL